MNNSEKMDYMKKCLEVAQTEYEYMEKRVAEEPDFQENWERWAEYSRTHRAPNRSMINDNLRNVGRMAFILAREFEAGGIGS